MVVTECQTKKDEAGTAAIMTVELDAALGGRAVQYREVQGHETEKFLSYFKPCIIPQQGGVASGFKHAEVNELEHETRLYVCKGKHVVHVKEASLICIYELTIRKHLFSGLFEVYVTLSIIFRFLLRGHPSIMMTYSFWIPSLRFFSLMDPTHLFKRGLKLLKLSNTLKIPIMMANVRLLL